MTAQPQLLVIEELHSAHGLSRVLFGISLQVAAGECVCLLGRNGVGKTTTMRSVMGFLPPTAGRILWKRTCAIVSCRSRTRCVSRSTKRRAPSDWPGWGSEGG
jgi:ABC-type branched-subunit amino acid transport system ATPase component